MVVCEKPRQDLGNTRVQYPLQKEIFPLKLSNKKALPRASRVLCRASQEWMLLSSSLLMTNDGMWHVRLFQVGDLFLGQMNVQSTDGIL
jgi:hypothetical protein